MEATIYNNTVYSPNATVMVYMFGASSINFRNNIFNGRSLGSTITDPMGTYDHNLYVHMPMPIADKNPRTGDPKFANPGDVNGYRLRCDSPAIDAGVIVPGNGGRDFYGNAVSGTTAPNIGAAEGACIGGP
jgi:hypothetical protein